MQWRRTDDFSQRTCGEFRRPRPNPTPGESRFRTDEYTVSAALGDLNTVVLQASANVLSSQRQLERTADSLIVTLVIAMCLSDPDG